MLEQLIEKSTTFNPNTLNLADPDNLDILGEEGNFRLEWTDTGCYYLKDGLIKFINYKNGRTYQLERDWIEGEWNLYRHLYLKSWESKKFRIDVPLKREEINLHDKIWEYTEFYRPGELNGELFVDSNFEYLIRYKEDVYELLKAAKEVAQENQCQGIPLFELERLKDQNGYYFIKNFKEWNSPTNKVVKHLLKQFMMIQYVLAVPAEEMQRELISAKELWSSLS